MKLSHPRFQHQALGMAATALFLAGCTTPAPETWRVAPNYQVSHAGPGPAVGYMALARQYEGERRWREARDAWRKAALAAPQDADTLNALGLAEAGQGLYADAVSALRRAVALAPQRVQLLNNLGYALLLDGQTDEARNVLKEALARSPQHPLARANLNRIDQLAGDVNATVGSPKEAASTSGLAALNTPPPGSLVEQSLPSREPVPRSEAEQTNALERAAPTFSPARMEIANGNGVRSMAAALSRWLRARGLTQKPSLTNARPYNTVTTVVYYRAGYLTAAQELVESMPQRVELAPEPGGVLNVDIRVVLGRDLRPIDGQI